MAGGGDIYSGTISCVVNSCVSNGDGTYTVNADFTFSCSAFTGAKLPYLIISSTSGGSVDFTGNRYENDPLNYTFTIDAVAGDTLTITSGSWSDPSDSGSEAYLLSPAYIMNIPDTPEPGSGAVETDIAGQVRIEITSDTSINGQTRIEKTASKTIRGRVRVKRVSSTDISGRVRIVGGNVRIKTIQGRVRVITTVPEKEPQTWSNPTEKLPQTWRKQDPEKQPEQWDETEKTAPSDWSDSSDSDKQPEIWKNADTDKQPETWHYEQIVIGGGDE